MWRAHGPWALGPLGTLLAGLGAGWAVLASCAPVPVSPDRRPWSGSAARVTPAVRDATLPNPLLEVRDASSPVFSPDGRAFAGVSGVDPTEVRIWRVQDGKLLRALTSPRLRAPAVAFSPDGRSLGVGAVELPPARAPSLPLSIWSVKDGRLLRVIPDGKLALHVAFSPDGRTIAASGLTWISLFRLRDGSLARKITGHSALVSGMAFAPDGKTIASASLDTSVRIWGIEDQAFSRALWPPPREYFPVRAVAFAPDGARVASGGEDGRIWLWEVANGRLSRTIRSANGTVECLAFSPDGQSLACGGRSVATDRPGNRIEVWRVPDAVRLTSMAGDPGGVRTVVFSPDGTLLATAGSGGIRVWRLDDLVTRAPGRSAGPWAQSSGS